MRLYLKDQHLKMLSHCLITQRKWAIFIFCFFCTDERAGVKGNFVLLPVYCQNWGWTLSGKKINNNSDWNCNYTSIFTAWWIWTSTTWDAVQKQTHLHYIPTQGWKYKKLQVCGAPRQRHSHHTGRTNVPPPSGGSVHFRFFRFWIVNPRWLLPHLQIKHSFLPIVVLFYSFFAFSVAADTFCLLLVLFCFSLVLSERRKAKLHERELEKNASPPHYLQRPYSHPLCCTNVVVSNHDVDLKMTMMMMVVQPQSILGGEITIESKQSCAYSALQRDKTPLNELWVNQNRNPGELTQKNHPQHQCSEATILAETSIGYWSPRLLGQGSDSNVSQHSSVNNQELNELFHVLLFKHP